MMFCVYKNLSLMSKLLNLNFHITPFCQLFSNKQVQCLNLSALQTLKMRWLHIVYPVVKNFSGKSINFIARIFNQVIIVFKEKK